MSVEKVKAVMSEDEINSAAIKAYQFLEQGVGDMIPCEDDEEILDHLSFISEDMHRKAKKALKNGVTDLHGWAADELFNHAGVIQDLLGDKIYDLCRGNWADMVRVAGQLQEKYSHIPMRIATNRMIFSWRKSVLKGDTL